MALLCERPLGLGVPELQVASVRAAMGPISAAVVGGRRRTPDGRRHHRDQRQDHHHPPAAGDPRGRSGRSAGVIGTLTGARTTPEAPDLQRGSRPSLTAGGAAVAMEVSSPRPRPAPGRRDPLPRRRVHQPEPRPPRLPRHHRAATSRPRRCCSSRSCRSVAVVNVDDPHGRLLRDAARIPTVGYSLDDADDLVVGRGRHHVHLARHAVRRAARPAGSTSRTPWRRPPPPSSWACSIDAVRAVSQSAGRRRAVRARRRGPAVPRGRRLRPHARRARAGAGGGPPPGRAQPGDRGLRGRRRPRPREAAADGRDGVRRRPIG